MTFGLCFLVFNERAGCEQDLPRIDLSSFHEVFAVDGGSTDGTQDILRKFGVKVHAQKVRGLNAAYWQAVRESSSDALIVFFPKATLDPSIVFDIRRYLTSGYELVIPSRQIPGASNEEDSKVLRPRKWGTRSLALTTALMWRSEGPVIWDVLHGVKGFTRSAFVDMAVGEMGVSIDLEMAIRAYRLKLRRIEFPVHERARHYGDSRFPIFRTGLLLARCLMRELIHAHPQRSSQLHPKGLELPDK